MDRCRRGDAPRTTADNTVEIHEADFLEKAKQLKLGDVQSFYKSRLFQVNRFDYDAANRIIRQTV